MINGANLTVFMLEDGREQQQNEVVDLWKMKTAPVASSLSADYDDNEEFTHPRTHALTKPTLASFERETK